MPSVGIVSLGCAKNRVDAELMLGVLVWRTWYMHRKKQKSLT